MNCKNVTRMLSAFQDNELSGKKILDIKNHLDTCPECRREHQKLITLSNSYRKIPKMSTPVNLSANIMYQINQIQSPASRKKFSFVFYGLMFLILTGFGFLFQANIPVIEQSTQFNSIKNQPLLSMITIKEDTSIVNFSEDLCQSLLTERGNHAK